MVKERACKNCHLITSKGYCPKCKTQSLSEDYSGIVIILNPKTSQLARRLNFDVAGKYALRVR
jgi:transcription elongation factor SPT4